MRKYYETLNRILNKINYNFLYSIPLIFRSKSRNDVNPEIKVDLNIFKKKFIIEKKKLFYNSEIIIISHYVGQNKKQIINSDPYYGNLFNKLRKEKKNFSVIFINHTNEDLDKVHKKYKKSNYSKAFVNNKFSIRDDLKILIKIILNYLYYKFLILNLKLKKKELIFIKKNFTFINFLKARSTVRLNNNIQEILSGNKSKLKILLTTFEGHAFEKLIFKNFYAQNVKTIGYFFSVLRKQPNNIFFIKDKRFCPKEIFVSGKILKSHFKSKYHDKNIKIKILGSNKKILLKNFTSKKLIKKKQVCLVAAEGIYSENYLLINFIVNNINYFENIEFRFRFHPVVNKHKILDSYSSHKNFNKLKLSTKNDILDDFKAADFILYRGSSVCIEAALNAVIPIYYSYGENIDPIFQINRLSIDNHIKLNNIFEKFKNKKKINTNLRYLSNLQSYCKDYYSEFTNKNLNNFF